MVTKIFVSIFLIVGAAVGINYWQMEMQKGDVKESINQLGEANRDTLMRDHANRNNTV